MPSRLLIAFAALAVLPLPIRAENAPTENLDAASVLWSRAPLRDDAKPRFERREFADFVLRSWSPLGVARDWRDTLRGTGSQARREFVREVFGRRVGLSLGNVGAPDLAGVSGAGVSAQIGALEVGTTLPANGLNRALSSFDELLGGQTPSNVQESRLMWLRAKPEIENGELELQLARGRRDLAPGAAQAWLDGLFYGARGRLQLPAKWTLRGEWASAQLRDDESRARWQARAEGPLSHPFGEARVELETRQSEANFANLSNHANPNAEREARASVVQDVRIGALEGQLSVGANQQTLANAESEVRRESTDTRGQLRLNVTPNLSLRANADLQSAQTERDNASRQGDTARDEHSAHNGDVGVEWKSGALALAATVGRSQAESRTQSGEAWQNALTAGESRLGVEVRHEDGQARFAAAFAARDRDDVHLPSWKRLATLHVEAERRVMSGLRLRTTLDFARDRDAAWNDKSALARRVEAQMEFARAARLGVRLRDGAALPGAWSGSALTSPFNGLQSGNREFSARFEAGNASRGTNISLEYARQNQRDEQWRVGVTYR